MTSGNLADEPICIDPAEAEERLAGLADVFCHHDRRIHVACDDSVVRVVAGAPQPVRRSRGYAPLPLAPARRPARRCWPWAGSSRRTVVRRPGGTAWLSQHIGDTANLETLAMLARTVETLCALQRVDARGDRVSDAHPGYLSRRWAAEEAARPGDRAPRACSTTTPTSPRCWPSTGCPPDEPVLGSSFDGTGYGTDGTIWGGELLLGCYAAVERVGHLRPVALPGGDAAVRRPLRTALAHLHAAGLGLGPAPPSAERRAERGRRRRPDAGDRHRTARPRRAWGGCSTRSPRCSTCARRSTTRGRPRSSSRPWPPTAAVAAGSAAAGPWPRRCDRRRRLVLDPRAGIAPAVADHAAGSRPGAAARAFHEALAEARRREAAVLVRDGTASSTVGLTGGVFANAVLTAACQGRLAREQASPSSSTGWCRPTTAAWPSARSAVAAGGGVAPR